MPISANEILAGINGGQLVPYFQPKIQNGTKKITGSEALIRWRHPQKGILLPKLFLPTAKENQLLPMISNIVIDESLNLLSILKDRNLSATIAINIDECNLASSDFAVAVKEKCQKKKIDTSMIYFEISETFTLDDEKLFSGVLSLYKEGFNLSVDDFGTKLSTIQRLIELPIREVKFDKFFLVESKKSEKGKFLFHELLQMINSINCAIVIEGVETRDHLESVSHLDFCQLQGFYFSPGVEGKAFSKLLGEQPFAS